MGRSPTRYVAAAALAAACWAPPFVAAAAAAEVRAAVAANFTATAIAIAEAFEAATAHEIVMSFGSTGQLYAQIGQAAPFDVFLAADEERPARLVAAGLAEPGSRVTYAIGRLVLWSAEPDLVTGAETLREADFSHLAIADPAASPYGLAAIETMAALEVADDLAPKLVRGLSIAQAFQFVASGNAELGFVALSQVHGSEAGSRWLVPADLHPPIRQDAVLLAHGAGNVAASAFLDFLGSETAQRIIVAHGYGVAVPDTDSR